MIYSLVVTAFLQGFGPVGLVQQYETVQECEKQIVETLVNYASDHTVVDYKAECVLGGE